VGGDTLSSGVQGNCLASVNNVLSIVAPGGAMDNHTAGAGWAFRLTPGSLATQFGCIVVDQTNHMMTVETWLGGVLQNTLTVSVPGGFPNMYTYFEDTAGFDEVRFQNPATNGGWGIDDFTLGNQSGGGGGFSLSISSPMGPGSIQVDNAGMTPNDEVYNVFTFNEPCPAGPGSGPFLGLCTTDVGFLALQVSFPLGALPFHFLAPGPTQTWGPFPAGFPSGTVLEGVAFTPNLVNVANASHTVP
jgi:hypothetical protein